MKRPIKIPVLVPLKMERNIKRYFHTKDLNEQKRIDDLNREKNFFNTSYFAKLFDSSIFKDWKYYIRPVTLIS